MVRVNEPVARTSLRLSIAAWIPGPRRREVFSQNSNLKKRSVLRTCDLDLGKWSVSRDERIPLVSRTDCHYSGIQKLGGVARP